MLSSIFAHGSGNVTTPTALNNPGLSQPLSQLDTSWQDEGPGMQLEHERGPDPFPSIGGPARPPEAEENRFGASSTGLPILGAGGERQLPQNPFADLSQRPSHSTGGDSNMGDGSQISSMTPAMVYDQVTEP